jgi:hypothetical protein
MSLKVIYKEQDIKSYKKKGPFIYLCTILKAQAKWFFSGLGAFQQIEKGCGVCTREEGWEGEQKYLFLLSSVCLNFHLLIQQMLTVVQLICTR